MKYKIVSECLPATVEREVNELIKDGWIPHGPLVVHSNNGTGITEWRQFQVMTYKFKKQSEPESKVTNKQSVPCNRVHKINDSFS